MLGADGAIAAPVVGPVAGQARGLVAAVVEHDLGHAQPAPAALERAQVEVPVLVARQRGVEAADGLEQLAPHQAGRRDRRAVEQPVRVVVGKGEPSPTRRRRTLSRRRRSQARGRRRAGPAGRQGAGAQAVVGVEHEQQRRAGRAAPALRAADTPALGWCSSVTPSGRRSNASSVSGSVAPSSTTITRGGPPSWARALSTASCRKRPYAKQGMTTVTSSWPLKPSAPPARTRAASAGCTAAAARHQDPGGEREERLGDAVEARARPRRGRPPGAGPRPGSSRSTSSTSRR